MSAGASIYAYRTNFLGDDYVRPAKPYKKSITLNLVDLFRPYYFYISKYDEDLWVSICQRFMQLGYPDSFTIEFNKEGVTEFLMNCLFSVSPFLAEGLWINRGKFNLYEWRKQFDIFSPTTLGNLRFYRRRSAIPIEAGSTVKTVKQSLLLVQKNEKLPFQFNSCHARAVWIKNKYISVWPNSFTYGIEYGYKLDKSSSWSVKIRSKKGENYIDFLLRVAANYEKIVAGDQTVLVSEYEKEPANFYLGGEFELKEV